MTSPHPLVSVIIPTYNQAALLQKALQSVINQTCSDWEAIVIDNNSTDETKVVVESIHDERIRYVAFSNNGIIAASRNHGIRLATGDIVAFLDSDDLWYPSKLSTSLDSIKNGADAVCHGLWIRKDGILDNKLGPEHLSEKIFETLLYKGNSGIATSAVMVKKECFDRFGVFSEDPTIVTAEDYELWLRLAKRGIRWGFIPEVLGEYTVHGKNASGNVRKQMLAEERIVASYYNEREAPPLKERLSYRKRRMMVVFRAGARVWQSGNRFASLPYLLKGIFRIFC
jgi:glycosyltransferase involved in cell wall biosynthesis